MSSDSVLSSESEDDNQSTKAETSDIQLSRIIENKPSKKSKNFISRNIELAGDACGVLAFTDDEKKRLCDLLRDEDDSEAGSVSEGERSYVGKENMCFFPAFTVDPETDALLQSIDLKLQEFQVERCTENEETKTREHEDEVSSVYEQKDLKMKNCLKDIDCSLKHLEESAAEKIEPVSQEEIVKILNTHSCKTMRDNVSAGQGTSSDPECQQLELLPREAIDQVIQDAKNYMPLFQFKH
ncbi:fibrous sheath-interacting protein 1-like isoform X2 [Bacillus rossius redtenbacheri]|uniref:fibrous sheath-interacting protein 1-like isoform X2 n=1 Tax=Bacillus rossius redtenbacheri TaxID=93214 RepID=UPI002FDE64E1